MIKWLKNIAEKNIRSSTDDSLQYMRETSFNYVAIISFFIGIVAVILSVYKSVLINDTKLIVVDLVAIFIFLFLAFGTSILSYKLRLRGYASLSIILGVIFILLEGPYGAGFIYFIAFNMLTGVFYGRNKLFISLFITISVFAALAFVIHFNVFPSSKIHHFKTVQFVTVAANVLIISSLSFVMAIMVGNLDRTIKHKERLRKQLHENNRRLSEAKKRAEESEQLKSSFLANMSHEIRTPMNAILGFAELAIDQPDITPDENKMYLNTIFNSGEYLMNIIDNILDASLLDSGQMKINISVVDIESVFNDLEALFYTKTKNSEDVKLVFQHTNAPDKNINTDEQRLKQVLINLINNAFKFTREGKITVGYRFMRNDVEFFVRDSGIGIKTEDQSKIFDRFVKVQSDENTAKTKGAGLGLSISKGIVKRLGGNIYVQSVLGKGTIFHFKLPYDRK